MLIITFIGICHFCLFLQVSVNPRQGLKMLTGALQNSLLKSVFCSPNMFNRYFLVFCSLDAHTLYHCRFVSLFDGRVLFKFLSLSGKLSPFNFAWMGKVTFIMLSMSQLSHKIWRYCNISKGVQRFELRWSGFKSCLSYVPTLFLPQILKLPLLMCQVLKTSTPLPHHLPPPNPHLPPVL